MVGCSRSSSSASRWTSSAIVTARPRDQRSADEGWLPVVAPMQPSSLDERGYPGWVLAAPCQRAGLDCSATSHRSRLTTDSPDAGLRAEAFIADGARKHLGLPVPLGRDVRLGSGLSPGLRVHRSLRRIRRGLPPRCRRPVRRPVRTSRQPTPALGDLYFFAHDGERPHHVWGIVTGPGRMLHAPETGSAVIEEALTPARQTSFSSGRGACRTRSSASQDPRTTG